MKKIIISVLSLTLLFSSIPLSISAEESINNATFDDGLIVIEDEEEVEEEIQTDDQNEEENQTEDQEDKNENDDVEDVDDSNENTHDESNNESTNQDDVIPDTPNHDLEDNEDLITTPEEDSQVTEEDSEDKISDYDNAKKEEVIKNENLDKKIDKNNRNLEENEKATVSNPEEFIAAYTNNEIKEINILSDEITLTGNKSYSRSSDLVIKSSFYTQRNANLKFKPDFMASKYGSLEMNHGNLSFENINIKGTSGGSSNLGYILKVDYGNAYFKNTTVSEVKGTEFLRGIILDTLYFEDVDFVTEGNFMFNVESSNNLNVNMSGAKNKFETTGKSAFLLKNGTDTTFNGGSTKGTTNEFRTHNGESFIKSDGDIFIYNTDLSEARVDKNYLIESGGLVYIEGLNILRLSSGRDQSGFAKTVTVNLYNSTINTEGKVGNFISAKSAEMSNTDINIKMEKGLLTTAVIPGFFDGLKLDIKNKSNITLRTHKGGIDNITPNAIFRLSTLLVDDSIVNVSATESGALGGYVGSIIHTSNATLGDDTKFQFTGGSKVNITSESTKSLFKIGTSKDNGTIQFLVEGKGTEFNVESTKKIPGETEGIFQLYGQRAQSLTEETGFHVKDGAKMHLSGLSKLIYSGIKNGGLFSVSGPDSVLNFNQKENSANTHALLFENGEQRCRVVDGGEIKIDAPKVSKSALKMAGGSNRIEVLSGGRFIIDKDGDRNLIDDKANAAIEFSGKNNQFNVSDKGSYINLFSSQGPIIVGTGSLLEIINLPEVGVNIDNNGSFIARGKSSTTFFDPGNNSGVFNVSQFKLSANEPGYLDLSNKRKGGKGRVLSKNGLLEFGAENDFRIEKSNFSLWEIQNGSDGYDNNTHDPDKTWIHIDVTASGRNLQNVVSSDRLAQNYISDNGGLVNFSRISSNNLTPEIRGLHRISDTDQYIYGKVVVPNLPDYSEYRAAWDNEVFVNIQQYDADGNPVRYHQNMSTVGLQSAIENNYDIYDFDQGVKSQPNYGAGHFRINMGDGNFATKDYTFEIESAYILKPVYNSLGDIVGNEQVPIDIDGVIENDNLELKQKVYDKTPPKPVKLLDHLYTNTRSISGIAGLDTEIVEMYDSNLELINSANVYQGLWLMRIPLTARLSVGDEYIFVAVDEQGNRNPFTPTQWHDAQFDEAKRAIVREVRYSFEGNNLFYHIDDPALKQLVSDEKIQEEMGIKVIDKTNYREVDFDFKSEDNFDVNDIKVGRYNFAVSPKQDAKARAKFFIEVYDDSSHIEDENYIIFAHDFFTNKHGEGLSNEELIEKANARGFNKKTGSSVEVYVSDRSEFIGIENNNNNVSFSIKNHDDLTIKVAVTMLDYDTVTQNENTLIMANNFIRPLYDFKEAIKDEEIIKLSKAEAYTLERYIMTNPREVIVDNHTIEMKEGLYHADLSAGEEK